MQNSPRSLIPRSSRLSMLSAATLLAVGASVAPPPPANAAGSLDLPDKDQPTVNSPGNKENSTGIANVAQRAHDILAKSNKQGGLVVHLGSGDGQLTAALHSGGRYVVHGLETDAARCAQARAYVHAAGLYGPVSIDTWNGSCLPYADNLVNLIVSEATNKALRKEMLRVLAPGGVAIIEQDGVLKKTVKPRPDEIDEWTHHLHGPSNNAVADDSVVGPPQRLQWVNPPLWSRSHEHLESLSAMVSAGGRVFYIMDKAPAADIAIPPTWILAARDAFNGVSLWKRSLGPWEWHLRAFRSGPPDLARRLVAQNDHVYVTLGYGAPVTALDAATGATVHTYEQTDNTQEILLSDGVLYLVVGEETRESSETLAERAAQSGLYRGVGLAELRPRTQLMAVSADSGETLWRKTGPPVVNIMPTTLAVADGHVFFQNPLHVIALDARDGTEKWRAERPISRQRPSWTAPTLVVYDGVVLSGDREAPGGAAEGGEADVKWTLTNEWGEDGIRGAHAPIGELIAFSADTGRRLWSAPCREGFNAPPDVLVSGGLVWTGNLVLPGDPGIVEGRCPHTGEVVRTRPPDSNFYAAHMSHARCHRSKATSNYLLTSRSGVEFVDINSGVAVANHWVRGECQFGILPANGLLYVPPHPCACFILAKLNSFHALAPGEFLDLKEIEYTDDRLEKGPAYGEVEFRNQPSQDWPTYRHDAARRGSTTASVPSDDLSLGWEMQVGERLTPPVASSGRVYVASPETHTLHALDAEAGEQLWQFTAGARVDSPPTIWKGRVFFGSADGWVYCLRADDGELVWRYRAAPKKRLIASDGQLESAWPVHGSVLGLPAASQQGGDGEAVVYAAAGRSSYLDGGIVLVRLDAASGHKRSRTVLQTRDPDTGFQPHPVPGGRNMRGALNDVLSAQEGAVFMRHQAFSLDGTQLDDARPHLHSHAGFLDDSWWHRSYWFVGPSMRSGWGGWVTMGNLAPSGRLLVLEGEFPQNTTVYGFGRDRYGTAGAHVSIEGERRGADYRLFAQDMSFDPRRESEDDVFPWQKPNDLYVRGMVLANTTLFVAGPDRFLDVDDPAAVWKGREGGLLRAICADDGRIIREIRIDTIPVFDGLIATEGRLYMSTADGRVLCFK